MGGVDIEDWAAPASVDSSLNAPVRAHESDEELRARWRPEGEAPSLLSVVLAEAALVNAPPTTLRGETVGVAHVRIYAGADSFHCCALEQRLRDRLPLVWRVDVLPEPETV